MPTLNNWGNDKIISDITLKKEMKKTGDYMSSSFKTGAKQVKLDDDVHVLHNMLPPGGEKDPYYKSYFENFDRYYSIYPDLESAGLRQYVFIVRPDLNILDEKNPNFVSEACKKDNMINNLVKTNNIVMRQLTDQLSTEHDFMTFVTGRIESLQIPDMTIKNYSISQPYTNLLMPYGGNAWESKTGGTFDITFRDDRYLRLHKMFQVWVHYIDGVTRNSLYPKQKYTIYNKIDYATSVYYFICDVDGETLLWWSKYTGAFPITVPNSDLSFNLRGSYDARLSIPFVYFYHEALNVEILHDFNRNANPLNRTYINSYNPDVVGTDNAMAGAPFIYRKNTASNFKLRWGVPKKF